MTVDRTQLGCQTRYMLREGATLSCALTFSAGEGSPPEWKVLVPGAGGSCQLDVMDRFAAPADVRLRPWLALIIGPARGAELAEAVGAQPPPLPGYERHAPAAAGLSIPRQRDYRA